jgi:hypothetical protein
MAIGGDDMAQAAVASRSVANTPNKPEKGKPFRVHLYLPGDLVVLIDEYAATVRHGWAEGITRTKAIEILLAEALKKHGHK